MKNSLVIYYDILEQLEDFSDEQFGHLLRAVIRYDMTGDLPNLKGNLNIVFKMMKPVLDKNKDKYEELCEKRRIAGSKGGKQKVANATNCYQNNQELASVADNVNDNEYDNDTDNENDIYKVSKKESNKEINNEDTHTHERMSYDEIFECCNVSASLKYVFIEFIRHCQLNGHLLTNDKLMGIIVKLDMAYGTNDVEKIKSLQRAINGGYFDIQEGRV